MIKEIEFSFTDPANGPGVYLINMKGSKYYKIGLARKSVYRRRSTLQVGCPIRLDIIAVLSTKTGEGLPSLESDLHKQYECKAVIGEWFKFEDADVKALIDAHGISEAIPVKDKISTMKDYCTVCGTDLSSVQHAYNKCMDCTRADARHRSTLRCPDKKKESSMRWRKRNRDKDLENRKRWGKRRTFKKNLERGEVRCIDCDLLLALPGQKCSKKRCVSCQSNRLATYNYYKGYTKELAVKQSEYMKRLSENLTDVYIRKQLAKQHKRKRAEFTNEEVEAKRSQLRQLREKKEKPINCEKILVSEKS